MGLPLVHIGRNIHRETGPYDSITWCGEQKRNWDAAAFALQCHCGCGIGNATVVTCEECIEMESNAGANSTQPNPFTFPFWEKKHNFHLRPLLGVHNRPLGVDRNVYEFVYFPELVTFISYRRPYRYRWAVVDKAEFQASDVTLVTYGTSLKRTLKTHLRKMRVL